MVISQSYMSDSRVLLVHFLFVDGVKMWTVPCYRVETVFIYASTLKWLDWRHEGET